MPATAAQRSTVRNPIRVTLEAVRSHTRHGRRYRAGERYDVPLRLAGGICETGAARPVATGTHDWWAADGRLLLAEPGEAVPHSREAAPGALRILQGCGYDPGSAAYRFHTALNETTRHASAFVRWHDQNPHSSYRQLDLHRDWPTARHALESANVLHCHVDYGLLTQLGYRIRRRDGQTLVRHYHGSRPTGPQPALAEAETDDEVGAVLVGARLTLCALRPGRIHWLPIGVPVARYAAMRAAAKRPEGATFRIAHSPTVRAIKGTEVFLRVCARLVARGVAVEPVLIEGMSHADALATKATCDATFDSFWLGIQGSGLEGGAMGMPVVAGDADVAALYRSELGAVPYTFADGERALEEALERLAVDRAWYDAEAARVSRYVTDHHDYAAVAARYETILALSPC